MSEHSEETADPAVTPTHAPGSASDDAHEVSTPPGVPAQEDPEQPGLAEGGGMADRPAPDSAEDAHAGTLDVDDEQPDPDASSEETAVQRENTEASTEQPSQ